MCSVEWAESRMSSVFTNAEPHQLGTSKKCALVFLKTLRGRKFREQLIIKADNLSPDRKPVDAKVLLSKRPCAHAYIR